MQVVRVVQRAPDFLVDIVAPFLVTENHSQNSDAIATGNPPIRMDGRPVVVIDAVLAQLHKLGRQCVESDPGVLPVFLFLVNITLQPGQDDVLASPELIHSCQGTRHPVASALLLQLVHDKPESAQQIAGLRFLCDCLLAHGQGQNQSCPQSLMGHCHVSLQLHLLHGEAVYPIPSVLFAA